MTGGLCVTQTGDEYRKVEGGGVEKKLKNGLNTV